MNITGNNFAQHIAQYASDGEAHIAVYTDHRKVSFRQLNETANRIANALYGPLSVRKGERVGCYLNNCPEFLSILLACSKTGTIFVPFNILLTPDGINACYDQCQPKLILTNKQMSAVLSDTLSEKDALILSIDGMEFEQLLLACSVDEPQQTGQWDDDFLIIYTSGTTGAPKGSLFAQRGVIESCCCWVDNCNYQSTDKLLLVQQLCFAGGLVGLTLPMLSAGGGIYLEQKFDAAKALALIQEEHITRLSGAPTIFGRIAALPEFSSADLSSIRQFEIGGMPVPPHLENLYSQKGVHFMNGYGLTESCGAHLIQASRPGEEYAFRPMNQNKVLIVDSEGKEVPQGTQGELLLGGPTILKRYWNNPEGTAATKWGDWLRTGDLGYADENGHIHINGRSKDLIISGALNISSKEVNDILIQHPDVKDSVVFGLPHPDWGEAVSAAVTLKDGHSVDEQDIIRWCKEQMPSYKTPKVIFILKQLPYNAGEKIQTHKLQKQFAEHFNHKK